MTKRQASNDRLSDGLATRGLRGAFRAARTVRGTEQPFRRELAAQRTGCHSLCVDYTHPSYLNRPSCRVVGCTWGDTCISGRSPCPRRCADSPRCHGYTSLRLHETRQPSIIICRCETAGQLHGVVHVQIQSLWFLASSNPGRHSQATPPLGVSLQMWAQPCSLFMQLRPSEVEKDTQRQTLTLSYSHWPQRTKAHTLRV